MTTRSENVATPAYVMGSEVAARAASEADTASTTAPIAPAEPPSRPPG